VRRPCRDAGRPTADYGDLPVAVAAGTAKRPAPQPAPPPARRSTKQFSGPTIESTDQRLAAALLAEKIAPTVDNLLRVADEYRRVGVMDAAETRLRRAVQQDPRRSDAHEALARLWRDWGLPDRALGHSYRAIAADPLSASAVNTLGTILAALDRWSEARDQFARAATMAPAAGWAMSNLCYAEFRLGVLHDARAHCEAAVAITPDLGAAHNNRGLVLAASGDLDAAYAEFDAAGGAGTAEFNTGIIQAANEDYEAAAEAFERAIRLRPDSAAARARAHQARLKLLPGHAQR
jgi:Tfp pilus assembly protein PilF